jgi:lipid-binding SYLF domain-containing protein
MKSLLNLAFTCCVILALPTPAQAQFSSILGSDKSIAQQQEEILKNSKEILGLLYQAQPKTQTLIENALGYATFSNFAMKIFIAGGGSGTGVVIKKDKSKPVFMNMAEVQAGLGVGIKSTRTVFIFQTQAALNDFVNSGWTFGGQATAAAKYEKDGGALQDAVIVSPGVLMYQLTDSGLAAEITGKGTKYYKSSELNK